MTVAPTCGTGLFDARLGAFGPAVPPLAVIKELGIDKSRYGFQTLLGVRPQLARMLARNHVVRFSVLDGPDACAPIGRRLRENPCIAATVVRARLSRTALFGASSFPPGDSTRPRIRP